MLNHMKNKSFLKNSLIYAGTEVINKAVPFLLLPVMTHYLTPSDYGIVATYGAFIAILAVFIHLSMAGAVQVNFFKLSNDQLKTYIFNVFIILGITTSIALLFILLFHLPLSEKLDVSSFWLFLGVLMVFMQLPTLINLVLWQVEQHAKPYGTYQILQMLTNTSIGLILIVGLGMDWEGQLIAQAVSTILFGFLSLIFIYKRSYLTFDYNASYIKDALKFGGPLIPHSLSGWLKTGVDRIFLTTIVGTSATGFYSIGYQFGMIIGILAVAFNQAYSPYLYKKLENIGEKEKRTLVKQTYLYFFTILLFASILSYIAPWVINTFLDERYGKSIPFIPWIAFSFAFGGMYFMVVNYILYMKKTFSLSIVTFTTSLIHIALSYLLINTNGEIGAAQATLISSSIMFIGVWILSNKVYKMPWFFRIL